MIQEILISTIGLVGMFLISRLCWLEIKDDQLIAAKEVDVGHFLLKGWIGRVKFITCGLLAIPSVVITSICNKLFK